MRKHLVASVIPFLLLTISMSSQAETDLTGTWIGQFKGVFITVSEVPQGLFSSRSYEQVRREERKPEFMEIPVTASIEKQQDDLLYGHWAIQEPEEAALRRGDDFVCTMTGSNKWDCVDPGGTIEIEVKSPTEVKICYLAKHGSIQGAGCGSLKKSQ